MPAPTNTYNSVTDLSLGQVPQVDDDELYTALLDMHNAIESLLSSSDGGGQSFNTYLAKKRNNTTVTANYIVDIDDGTVRVNATAGDIIITMLPVVNIEGYHFDIKRIDSVPANTVTIVGALTELIDGRALGIKVSTKSSYTVKANTSGWDII